jgi:short-subunit dehydrogenase
VGYQVAGFVQNTPVEVYDKNYRVNTLAPIALIQCTLPDMIDQNKGVIANVMSSIMYHAFPGVSSYCASKCALGAIHESLKSELSGTNVKTLRIRPGSFKSNYWVNTDVDERIRDFKLPSSDDKRDPSFVAAKICEAIEKGDSEINLSTLKDKIGYHLSYWAPGALDRIIVDKNRNLVDKYPGKKVAMANY